MSFNPDCTPGWTSVDPEKPDEFVAHCGCGWSEAGWSSRTKAKAAQREHRFPGPNPRDAEAAKAPVVFSSP